MESDNADNYNKEENMNIEEKLYGIHVCAWCKCIYDDEGKRLVKLDDDTFTMFPSHGICIICKTTMLTDIRNTHR